MLAIISKATQTDALVKVQMGGPELGNVVRSVDEGDAAERGHDLSKLQAFMCSYIFSVSSAAVPGAQPVLGSIKLIMEPASTKIQHTTKNSATFEPGTFAVRDKPSGLRMPSPKLGFFDTNKTASQVPMPREKPGHGCGVNGVRRDVATNSSRYTINQNQGLKHPAASAKPSYQLLEVSRKQGIEVRKSSSIPSAPHVHKQSLGAVSMRVTPAQEVSRSVSYPTNRVNKQMDNVEQVLQARKNAYNGSSQGKPATLSQPGYSSVRKNPRQENVSPDCKDGKGMLRKRIAAQGLAFENPNMRIFGEACVIKAVHESQQIAQNVVEPSQRSCKPTLIFYFAKATGTEECWRTVRFMRFAHSNLSYATASTMQLVNSLRGEQWCFCRSGPTGKRVVQSKITPLAEHCLSGLMPRLRFITNVVRVTQPKIRNLFLACFVKSVH